MMELSKRYKLNSRSWTRGKVIIVSCTKFFVLSVIDGALTLWGLRLGAIEEVNPVMQWLIEKSPIVFMSVKLPLPVILGFIFGGYRIGRLSLSLAHWGLFWSSIQWGDG